VFRPTSSFSTELGTNFDRSTNDAQWVTNEVTAWTTHYVFGRLSQRTSSITARVNYTVTPTLSVQVYAQPFVSTGLYNSFKELVNGRAEPTTIATRRTRTRVARLQGALVQDDERHAMGVQAGLDAVRRMAAGREGNRHEPVPFRFGRDYGDIFSTPVGECLPR
jgi:hypothetical protein